MENLKERKVGNLVAENYRYADVFKKYDIDFCCNGGVTVLEACKNKGLNYTLVISELQAIGNTEAAATDFKNWPLDKLVDYIVDKHHTYVREHLPLLIAYSDKVAKVHGDRYPETIEIKMLVDRLSADLMSHMDKEESILFPFIKKLLRAKSKNTDVEQAHFGSVKNPVQMMLAEHDEAGNIFKSISFMTLRYTPPTDACTTFKVLYHKLQEFETDLHKHIHLENNILFPAAINLEATLSDKDHISA